MVFERLPKATAVNSFANYCQLVIGGRQFDGEAQRAVASEIVSKAPISTDAQTDTVILGIICKMLNVGPVELLRLVAHGSTACPEESGPGPGVHVDIYRGDLRCAGATSSCSEGKMKARHDAVPVKVSAALVFIRETSALSSLTLADAADHVNTTPSHLDHLLKSHTHKTFLQHLRGYRVDAVDCRLLSTTDSIKSIAYSVGYRSLSRFGRDFRRIHSMSAAAWRRVNTTGIWNMSRQCQRELHRVKV